MPDHDKTRWIDTVPAALPHLVVWEIEPERITGTLSCIAPPAALCRLKCGEDCGSETYPCHDEDGKPHGLVDAGYCNAVLTFEASGEPLEFHYGGSRFRAIPKHRKAKVYWDGDNWLWEYLDDHEIRAAIEAGLVGAVDAP